LAGGSEGGKVKKTYLSSAFLGYTNYFFRWMSDRKPREYIFGHIIILFFCHTESYKIIANLQTILSSIKWIIKGKYSDE
jgi:hypothetical protein